MCGAFVLKVRLLPLVKKPCSLAITPVTVKPGLPLTLGTGTPYILHRGSYEGYS
jgi:hypothetical protein